MRNAHRHDPDGPRCPTTGKRPLTRDQARTAAKSLNKRQARDRWPVHPFYCKGCGRWHCGHVPRNDIKRKVERRSKRRRT